MMDGISRFSSVALSPTLDCQTPQDCDPGLAFHLVSNDYFPYLSTILGFVEETLAELQDRDEMARIQLQAIQATRNDLKYLHDNCRIETAR